jgi:hypothetical protein
VAARSPLHAAALALLLAGLGACATAPRLSCPDGQRSMTSDSLYFGTAKPQGAVSPDEWRAFLQAEVTPRFPDGLTVIAANGQWRGADGTIAREPSYVLNLVHAPGTASDRAIAEIIASYRQRFRQEAVLRVSVPACVAL